MREAQHRYQDIAVNGMAGGVKDWNMRLRFLRETNRLIEEAFVPALPPVPQPEHWTPATASCSQLLPYFNFVTKYISISSDDCLLGVVARHGRLFPAEHGAFMNVVFPIEDVEFDREDKGHRNRLWSAIYDTQTLLENKNGRPAYSEEHRRIFRKTVTTDGVACSVIFDKAVPVLPPEVEAQIREDVGEADEREANREAAMASFHRALRAGFEKAAALEDAAARGEIRLHVLAMDPGVGAIGTLARRTEGIEDRSRTFGVSTKKYYAEAGITRRQKWMQLRTNDVAGPGQLSVQQIQQGITSRTAPWVAAIHARSTYVLSHLDTLHEFYSRFRIDKFLNYRGKQIALERMVTEILTMENEKATGAPRTRQSARARKNAKQKRKKSRKRKSPVEDPRPVRYILIWGNAKVGSMTFIKKHLRGPHKKLMQLMELRGDVTIIIEDEYGTSKCCTRCDQWTLDTAKCRQMPKATERTQMPANKQPQLPDWHPPMVIMTKKPW